MKTILLIILAVFLTAQMTFAQNLTNEQKEVWETVEAYTEKSHERNFEAYIEFFHPDFEGWHLTGWENPTDYETRIAGLKHFFASTESIMYKLELHSVRVFNDVAVVQYTNRIVAKNKSDGKEEYGVSKWTDILKKVEGRWYLIADHGD